MADNSRDALNGRITVPIKAIAAHAASVSATVEMSEDALAVIFARAHTGELLHATLRGKWYRWVGTHWKADEGACATREMIRQTIRDLCGGKPRWATARVVDSIEKLARTDERMRRCGGFDASPLLLGTPAGVINLVDGTLRAARPDDLMTKLTSCAPDPDAACPRWLTFLGACIYGFDEHGEPRTVAPDDPMVIFLQRACGYMLTGSTRYEFVFLLFGGGANGKSTFLRVVREILADYFVSVAVETFLLGSHDAHPTGVAHLDGARLAACGELPDNRSWNSQRVKDISSGEKLSARHMRQDFFDFSPVCKLLFVGNHKPRLRQINEAERRRFRVIPFVHRVPENRRDSTLEEALRTEYPAILAWMIDGAQAVISEGFGTMPAAVTKATDEYFRENDTFGMWASERLLLQKDYSVPAGVAYANYTRWFDDGGYQGRPVSQREFRTRMEDVGAMHERNAKGIRYRGARLDVDADEF